MPKPTPQAEAALAAAVTKAAGLPHPAPPAKAPQAGHPGDRKSPAEWAYERVILYIRNFESQLNADQEVAMGFTGSEAGVMTIEGLGYFDPDILTFYGRDEEGAKTQLVQHVSQLNVMLRAVPKAVPEEPARRIGFRLATGWQGGEAGDGSA